jgi:hypothetical protein
LTGGPKGGSYTAIALSLVPIFCGVFIPNCGFLEGCDGNCGNLTDGTGVGLGFGGIGSIGICGRTPGIRLLSKGGDIDGSGRGGGETFGGVKVGRGLNGDSVYSSIKSGMV